MIVRLNSSFQPKTIYDVCVVGSGAAGITIAAQSRRLGLSVFLAEGGDSDFSDESQMLYRGTVQGDEYYDLDIARLRYFGGTTNHWGGMCRPLDAYDFEPKSASADSGWPIGIDEVRPYLADAAKILEVDLPVQDRIINKERTIKRVHYVYSPPVRFGEKYRKTFAEDSDMTLCLNCNLVGVNFDGNVVRKAKFQNFEGLQLEVSARIFVLACGGIENSRILLFENSKYVNMLGNQAGSVGKYWMEHPTYTVGNLHSCGSLTLPDDDIDIDPQNLFYLVPTPKFAEEKRIMNCRLRIERDDFSFFEQSLAKTACFANDIFGESVSGLIAGKAGRIRASWEQEPDRANAVFLGGQKDSLGIPRAILHWKKSPLVKKTLKTFCIEAGKYFALNSDARMRLHEWVLSDGTMFECVGEGQCPGAFHHMGGTRMAESPKTGVVDKNCRVFGTGNLFVAGSSVYPSSGYANPTMGIVQLSLRLADHLHTVIGAGRQ